MIVAVRSDIVIFSLTEQIREAILWVESTLPQTRSSHEADTAHIKKVGYHPMEAEHLSLFQLRTLFKRHYR